MEVLNYGGGRQTIAICCLIVRGILPKPDRIVMADTGREKRSTWLYLDTHIQPLLATIGMHVEIAPHDLATVDLYSHLGTMLMPVFTATGKFETYCSSEWKARVVDRYLGGHKGWRHWIGFSYDERSRIKSRDGRWFPLIERMLSLEDCRIIVAQQGLPPAPRSACWGCPNMRNAEWRHVRDELPDQFELACMLDEDLRADDIAAGNGGVWLHEQRVPLREADLELPDSREPSRQCSLGLCMISATKRSFGGTNRASEIQ